SLVLSLSKHAPTTASRQKPRHQNKRAGTWPTPWSLAWKQRLLALGYRHVIALRGARIELARAADLLLRIFNHLAPLRDPAYGTRHGEEHGEHRGGEAQCLQRDTRIEVDIRIELLLDEILVRQRNTLQLHGDVEQRIVLDAELAQNLMAGLLHDLGARVVVLVDAVAEAHEAERIVLVLRALDEFRDAIDSADLCQHVERCFVGATMRRTPKAGDARSDAGEWVCARRTGKTHRRGRGVLLVIGMQDENAVHGACQD